MNEQVKEYIEKFPIEIIDMYNVLRKLIFDSVSSDLQEIMWAKIPSYYVGESFVRIIPFKDHINIEAKAVSKYTDFLAGYKITPKGMLQIFVKQDIPVCVLKKIFVETLMEKYIKRCYELAIAAGKKGYDTFGAVLVCDDKIIAEAENTSDYEKGIFGHAEFNLVHKCANQFSDKFFEEAVFYTSCAPCVRCLMAIASLGIKTIVYGVSYKSFQKLCPTEDEIPNYEDLLSKMNVSVKMIGPILEDEGMHVFEWWGGEYRPLEELIREMDEIKGKV